MAKDKYIRDVIDINKGNLTKTWKYLKTVLIDKRSE